MSATIRGTETFGVTDDLTATGIIVGNCGFDFTSEQARVENHIGSTVGLSTFNYTCNVTLDGVIAIGANGIVPLVGDVCALANAGSGTSNLYTANIPGSHIASAGLIITSSGIKRNNKGFEMGNLTGEYNPRVSTSSTSTLAD